MSREINPELIEDQAFGTTLRAIDDGVAAIDEVFGDGYAKKTPVLLGAFIQAYATNRMVWQLDVSMDSARRVAKKTRKTIGRVAAQLEPLGDLAEAVGSVESAVRDVENPMHVERLAGIENELYKLANLAREFIEHRRERGNHGV